MQTEGGEPPRQAILAEALSWVGTPYRHQGRRKGVGCDCLGLVLGIWHAVYGSSPVCPDAYAADWAEAGGGEDLLDAARRVCRERTPDGALPGDLVLFRWRPHLPAKHAGILTGSERFLHAYQGSAVVVSPLVPSWRRRIAAVLAFPPLPAA